MSDKLFEKHIQLVEAVNNAKDQTTHYAALNVLIGFRAELDLMGINQLIECDMHYLNQGIDRIMCCGVFLDPDYEKKGDL